MLVVSVLADNFVFAQAPPMSENYLLHGLNSSLHLFEDLQRHWNDIITTPLAKKQAVRSLRKLSGSLAVLADRKLAIANNAIRASSDDGTYDLLAKEANDLGKTIEELRLHLHDVFKTLPDSYQSQAGKVQSDLSRGLYQKINSLEGIRALLRSGSVEANDVVADAQKVANLALSMKEQIDTLITALAS